MARKRGGCQRVSQLSGRVLAEFIHFAVKTFRYTSFPTFQISPPYLSYNVSCVCRITRTNIHTPTLGPFLGQTTFPPQTEGSGRSPQSRPPVYTCMYSPTQTYKSQLKRSALGRTETPQLRARSAPVSPCGPPFYGT